MILIRGLREIAEWMEDNMNWGEEEVRDAGLRVKAAQQNFVTMERDVGQRALMALSEALLQAKDAILAANAKDVEAGAKSGLSPAMIDRLRLDGPRIQGMVDGLRAVAVVPVILFHAGFSLFQVS